MTPSPPSRRALAALGAAVVVFSLVLASPAGANQVPRAATHSAVPPTPGPAAAAVGTTVPVALRGRMFGPDLDDAAPGGESNSSICSPVLRPGLVKFRDAVLSAYGMTWADQVRRGGGIIRDCGAGGWSEHKQGRAWDWMLSVANPTEKRIGDDFASWLTANNGAMARRIGVMYMIWNRKIWSAYRVSEGWRTYGGASPHTDHIHMSFSWDGAMGRTSWYTGGALHRSLCENSAVKTYGVTSIGQVPAAVVLQTSSGANVGAPCLLAQSATRGVKVTGVGGVPAERVTSVTVRLGVADETAPVNTVQMSTVSKTVSLPANGGQVVSTTSVMPLGSDGVVRVKSLSGSTNVALTVTGFTQAPPPMVYTPVTPFDAYQDPAMAPGQTASVKVLGLNGVPAGAASARLEVSVTAGQSAASVRVGTGSIRVAPDAGQTATSTYTMATLPGGIVPITNLGAAPVGVTVRVVGFNAPRAGTPDPTPALTVALGVDSLPGAVRPRATLSGVPAGTVAEVLHDGRPMTLYGRSSWTLAAGTTSFVSTIKPVSPGYAPPLALRLTPPSGQPVLSETIRVPAGTVASAPATMPPPPTPPASTTRLVYHPVTPWTPYLRSVTPMQAGTLAQVKPVGSNGVPSDAPAARVSVTITPLATGASVQIGTGSLRLTSTAGREVTGTYAMALLPGGLLPVKNLGPGSVKIQVRALGYYTREPVG